MRSRRHAWTRVIRLIQAIQFAFLPLFACAQSTPRVYRERIEPHWISDNSRFWYRNDNPGGTKEFILVDVIAGKKRPAFNHASIAQQIGDGATADKLPVRELEFGDDGGVITLIGVEKSWNLDIVSGAVSRVGTEGNSTTGIDPAETIRPSRNGGVESGVVFQNQLPAAVKLFWVDPSGERQPYGEIQPGRSRIQHTFQNHVWLITDADNAELALFIAQSTEAVAVIDGSAPKPRERPRRRNRGDQTATSVRSPDGQWEAFVRGGNLWIRRAGGGLEKQLSANATTSNSFHRDAIRGRAIGMNYNKPDYPATLPEVYWSPDSRFLLALQTTLVPEPRVTIVESSPGDQVQPKVETYPYIKPGDPIPQTSVRMFDAELGSELPVDQSLLQTPWSIGRYRWEDDSSRITFLYNQRGHQVLRLVAIDLQTDEKTSSSETRVLIEETSDTFIDYSQKTYLNVLKERGEILWMSERDGWNHLYLYDAPTGVQKRQLTTGEWMIRRIERADEKSGLVWFWAMGVHKDQDPYHQHLCRLDLNSDEGPVMLTESDGNHTIQWSPDNQSFIATWSRVDQPPVHELRRADDGSLVCRLEEADASEIETARYRSPERFVAKGRDRNTDIFGVIHFPKNFDPAKEYPVVENIYAGPHGAFVPKSFRARYRHQQEIADRGFVVVQIDGMGTNWRGKTFHDVAWKNIKDAGYPDRIAWMKAAAATRPWMDVSRVGVYGGSAGGQNAMRAVLDHPDFYQAAAADCGCHDNRMDKIWWNEAWMGVPGDGSYVKSSNVEDAHKLDAALLLTVGELDKNVDPSSTYQVVNALKKAGKPFEFMLMTGQGHGAAESEYGRKLRADFFVKYLQADN